MIGKGQFGKVHIAQKIEDYLRNRDEKRESNTLYACKTISLQGKNSKQIEEIEREAEVMSRLNHPNIIRLNKALRTKNTIYLITEYCDQGDLKTFLKKYIQTRKSRQGYKSKDEKPYLSE